MAPSTETTAFKVPSDIVKFSDELSMVALTMLILFATFDMMMMMTDVSRPLCAYGRLIGPSGLQG